MSFETLTLIFSFVFLAFPLAQLVMKLLPKPFVKRSPKLPGIGWRVIYTDNAPAGEERKPDVVYGKLLADKQLHIYGKPDFIYSNGRRLMPVELKSGKVGGNPYPREGDLMQLTVYFHLAEAEYGLRVNKGLLIYNDAMFIVRNTRRLRSELIETVNEMRYILAHPSEAQDEEEANFAKCRYCVCRGTVCEINE